MNKFKAQYNEIKLATIGMSMDDIRKNYSKDITNDVEEYIDMNYKNILVTFQDINGKAELTDCFEYYNDNGIFLGTNKKEELI